MGSQRQQSRIINVVSFSENGINPHWRSNYHFVRFKISLPAEIPWNAEWAEQALGEDQKDSLFHSSSLKTRASHPSERPFSHFRDILATFLPINPIQHPQFILSHGRSIIYLVKAWPLPHNLKRQHLIKLLRDQKLKIQRCSKKCAPFFFKKKRAHEVRTTPQWKITNSPGSSWLPPLLEKLDSSSKQTPTSFWHYWAPPF